MAGGLGGDRRRDGTKPWLSRAQWKSTLIFGLCQNALYLGLNFMAMQRVEASVAAIIASTMPLIVALLGWLVLGDKIRPLGVVGLVAGVLGVSIIMGSRLSGGIDHAGLAMCVPPRRWRWRR